MAHGHHQGRDSAPPLNPHLGWPARWSRLGNTGIGSHRLQPPGDGSLAGGVIAAGALGAARLRGRPSRWVIRSRLLAIVWSVSARRWPSFLMLRRLAESAESRADFSTSSAASP